MTAHAPVPKAKPLKRPVQARSKFTVQAIFDAFVRIWQRDGWARLSTRAVALEAGIATGTLYDYFPSKTALLSGYVRHCIEVLIRAVDEQAMQPAGLTWQERLHRLLRIVAGLERSELSWFHRDMMALEPEVAEPKHQRRAYEELMAMWQRMFDACDDLPRRPSAQTVEALHLAALAGRRSVGDSPAAQLAQILLLDQFTRNVYRDTPRAFAGDAAALALATAMVAAGADASLAPLQRWFVYLPFEHSEDIAVQERSVTLFAAFDQSRPEFASAYDYAVRHRDIVARFGRFPHRNAILGRRSTPEEIDFLAQPGSGF